MLLKANLQILTLRWWILMENRGCWWHRWLRFRKNWKQERALSLKNRCRIPPKRILTSSKTRTSWPLKLANDQCLCTTTNLRRKCQSRSCPSSRRVGWGEWLMNNSLDILRLTRPMRREKGVRKKWVIDMHRSPELRRKTQMASIRCPLWDLMTMIWELWGC